MSQDLDSSIASLKKQDSYDNMRQTLSKMHLSVNYVYKEMPARESFFKHGSKDSREAAEFVHVNKSADFITEAKGDSKGTARMKSAPGQLLLSQGSKASSILGDQSKILG